MSHWDADSVRTHRASRIALSSRIKSDCGTACTSGDIIVGPNIWSRRNAINGLLVRLPVRFGDEFERRVPGNSVVEGGPRSAPVQESGFASMTTRLAAVTRPNF